MNRLLAFVSVLFWAQTASAGAVAVPELDPNSLASGLGLAAAIVLVLSGRR